MPHSIGNIPVVRPTRDGELTGAAFVLYHTVRVTASVCGCLLFGKILDGIKRALNGKHRG